MTVLPGDTVGSYTLLEPLGEGGMGVVYRAHDERLARDVAVKLLREDVVQDPERLRRFEREARAVAALDHPNILAVHELGEHQGQPFIVTELLEGQSLSELIADQALTVGKVLEYGIQVAAALAAAHAKGIVHRDLKPGNLFVTTAGRVKILDFGLAKLVPVRAQGDGTELPTLPTDTASDMVLGTVGYMSPEQVRGRPADARSDIFALGAVLYEMLSRRCPFDGDSTAEVMALILREDPPPLRAVNRRVPPALDHLVSRCLKKMPDDRFASARDVALALEAVAREGEVRHLSVRTRRTWLALAAACLVGLGLVAYVLRGSDGGSRAGPEQASVRRIAVLPLENLSADPDRDFFADGMTEALITELGTVSSLAVIGTRSVMTFKGSATPIPEIARQLDVEVLVTGSVLESEGRVRIAAQLVDHDDGRVLWSQSYERSLVDILQLQGEVARAVCREIQAALTPGEERRIARTRQVDPEAYEAYLEGRHVLRQGKSTASFDYFERAVEIDPGYVEAHMAIADALVLAGGTGGVELPEARRRAREALDTALALDAELPGINATLGTFRAMWEWDIPGAERAFRRELELHPATAQAQLSYGQYLVVTGRFEESAARLEAARRLDPVSPHTLFWVAWGHCLARRYETSLALLERIRELDPDFWGFPVGLVITYAAQGRVREAAAVCDRLDSQGTGYCGQVYGMAGRREKALQGIRLLTSRAVFSPLFVAGIYAGLGDVEEAMAWIEKACEMRHPWLPVWLRVPIVADTLGHDPRYDNVLRRVGLEPL